MDPVSLRGGFVGTRTEVPYVLGVGSRIRGSPPGTVTVYMAIRNRPQFPENLDVRSQRRAFLGEHSHLGCILTLLFSPTRPIMTNHKGSNGVRLGCEDP